MYLINSRPKLSNLFNCTLLGYNLEDEFLELQKWGLQWKDEIKFNYLSKWNRRWSWEKRLTCYLQGGPQSGSWAPPAYHCSVQQQTSHLSLSVLFASRIILHMFKSWTTPTNKDWEYFWFEGHAVVSENTKVMGACAQTGLCMPGCESGR